MTWSLRVLIPVLVLIMALLQGLFFYVRSLGQIDARIEAEAEHDLQDTMSRLQGTLEYLFRKREYEQVQEEVTSLGGDDRVSLALLVDENDRVQASIRVADRGRILNEALVVLPPGQQTLLLEHASEMRERMLGGVVPSTVDSQCMSGIYPVVIGHDSSGLRPGRVGMLLLCLDLSREKSLSRSQLQEEMARVVFIFLLAAALLAVLLHFLVTHRMRKILLATHAFAQGDHHARTHVSGRDELGRIGHSLDVMVEQVAEATERLRDRETRFAAIFDSMYQFIGLLEPDGTLLEANKTSLDFIGAAPEDVVGKLFWETPWWPHEEQRTQLRTAISAASRGEFVRFEAVHYSGGGELIVVDFSLTPVRDADGDVVLLVPEGRNITDYKAAMEARERLTLELERSEAQWRRAMEFFSEPLFLSGVDGCLERANKAFYALYETTAVEALGKPVRELVHPRGESEGCPVCEAREALADGLFVLEGDDVHNAVGHPIEATVRVILDDQGEPQGVLTRVRDLTRQREIERELRRHRNQLEELVAERTTSLEASNRELAAFSYSVSHDLRSPLRAINGYSQFLLEDCAEQLDDVAKRYVQRTIAASKRMGLLIDNLLQLAKVTQRELVLADVDLTAIAEMIASQLQAQQPERTVEFHIQSNVTVQGDGGLVNILLTNLMDNAWKFSADRSPGVIEFGVEQRDGAAVCFVRDNGVGFDMQYIDDLFKPFHRLHAFEEFEGTGIGLATVARIVERHHGRIWAEAAVGKGATVYFTLGSRQTL